MTFIYLPEKRVWINLANVAFARMIGDILWVISTDRDGPCELTGSDRDLFERAMKKHLMPLDDGVVGGTT